MFCVTRQECVIPGDGEYLYNGLYNHYCCKFSDELIGVMTPEDYDRILLVVNSTLSSLFCEGFDCLLWSIRRLLTSNKKSSLQNSSVYEPVMTIRQQLDEANQEDCFSKRNIVWRFVIDEKKRDSYILISYIMCTEVKN
ncbi:hypothetical protein WA538_005595 [Blastocystis sp. DL]